MAADERPEAAHREAEVDSQALSLSADDFSALEERIVRAVAVVKQERQARSTAEQRTAQVELELREKTAFAEQLQAEVGALKAERDHVRQRVERLLTQLDGLEL
ncbi:MAG TPA: hypothetical protein VGS10_06575 [Terracidiphilus sp.]|nr:hypothetical protein [Terracidiphilus sp.]